MDSDLIERIKADMAYEFARTGPPDGFPAFHDIPIARHTSDEFWNLEQEHLWPNSWVIAGRVENVANPGDYFVFDRLGVALLVVCGADGSIRCFYNTCQHRGAPVVRDECGSARRLRCQYHSWTYDITSGSLISVPDERDFIDLDMTQRCLPQVACDVFAGFVFVNRNPDAEPLAEWIGPIAEMFEPFRSEHLREVYRRSEVIACNWKVTAEAFLEVYHFRHIHSHDGVSALDNRGAAMGLYPNGHSRMVTPFSNQRCAGVGMRSWDDWKPITQGPFPIIEGVPSMIACTSTAVSLFPNIIIPMGAIGYPVLLFWPIDKGTTRLDWIYFGIKDWEGEGLPAHWAALARNFDQIMGEDEVNMAPMQRSIESPAMTGIPLNYQERRIWHLHEQLDRTIGIDRIGPELRVAQLLEPYVER
jgi:phenylpropionate dioxygenase-like ring-hydroxylating dioxygenase large terminal subunit